MAAKKVKKKASPKAPDDGQVVHLSPHLLDFDLENPRLSQSPIADSEDDKEIIEFLWKEMNVECLPLLCLSEDIFLLLDVTYAYGIVFRWKSEKSRIG